MYTKLKLISEAQCTALQKSNSSGELPGLYRVLLGLYWVLPGLFRALPGLFRALLGLNISQNLQTE